MSDLGQENGVPPAEMMEAPFYVCISDQTELRLEIPAFTQESNKDINEDGDDELYPWLVLC